MSTSELWTAIGCSILTLRSSSAPLRKNWSDAYGAAVLSSCTTDGFPFCEKIWYGSCATLALVIFSPLASSPAPAIYSLRSAYSPSRSRSDGVVLRSSENIRVTKWTRSWFEIRIQELAVKRVDCNHICYRQSSLSFSEDE